MFGKPGSGKSFGVKEVVRHILGDNAPSLTFNLSEFRDVSELSRGFHLIHDKTRDGTTPLVFFDEFDASLGRDKLAWLKYFLAPMQDGTFNDGADVHPIGRAIFVFAGGTKHTYEDFAGQALEADFISAKGPDFLSRLRGFIDIMGTEPADHKDYFCMLRRAVMLRVSLEERAKTLGDKAHRLLDSNKQIHIDTGVLRAFLVPAFLNGVRSMTAILEVSELSSSRGFTRAALPSDSLLEMHTRAMDFRKLVALPEKEDPLFLPAREELAQLVHEKYRERNRGTENDKPWAELSEEIREDNRRQVDNYLTHLMGIGCTVELAEPSPAPYQLSPTDIENLAKLEHGRWCRDKRTKGWRPGADRNDLEKVHPDLVSWEDLPHGEERKDLDAMRDIPEILKRVGLCIVKAEP